MQKSEDQWRVANRSLQWTSNPHISWVPQVLAGIPIGAGILMIFMQGLNVETPAEPSAISCD